MCEGFARRILITHARLFYCKTKSRLILARHVLQFLCYILSCYFVQRREGFIDDTIQPVLLAIRIAHILFIILCLHPITRRSTSPRMHIIPHKVRVTYPFSLDLWDRMLKRHPR